ncbi:serine carboxypeptidase-like 45 [Phtheirospermum japonicum]|uniref:Serine carboxypeptidase-like 45 n=1 Tax=Phtheirospermum japonicum TaxID=374723 RepID=A0A830BDG9_9LAMI|nr:serine carboxypeptidase-like 45 [Phtheirospermum japonicum]
MELIKYQAYLDSQRSVFSSIQVTSPLMKNKKDRIFTTLWRQKMTLLQNPLFFG